jgi:hypothetical protein
MLNRLRCRQCRSRRVSRLVPRWEPWLRLALLLTLVGVPAAQWMARRRPGRGDSVQCEACACQFLAGKVRVIRYARPGVVAEKQRNQ